MKKTKNSQPMVVVSRENTALSLNLDYSSDQATANTSKSQISLSSKPLIELLALSSDFFIFSYSPSLKSLITWSDNAKSVLGVDDGRIARDGNLFLRHIHGDDRFQLLNDLEAALEDKVPFRATYRWIRPDRNEQRWLHCRAAITKNSSNAVFEGIILDITDELAGPLKYFSASESLHSILSALPGLVVILDNELRILRLSQPIENKKFTFGDSGFKSKLFYVGQKFIDCFSDTQIISQIKSISESLLSSSVTNGNIRIFENGRSYKVDFFCPNNANEKNSYSDNSNAIVCVVTDITELVKLEAKVAELQRIESLRLLSAGIGHHFNNALQTIIGQATIINTHSEDIELVRRASDSIVTSSLKASELTRQLFQTVEKSPQSLQVLDPNLALTEAVNNLNNIFKSGFEVSIVLGQIPLVLGNYIALKSIFETILRYAQEAITKQSGIDRRLSIKTYAVRLKEGQLDQLPAGKYSLINFSTHGLIIHSAESTKVDNPINTPNDLEFNLLLEDTSSGLSITQACSLIRSYGGCIIIDNKSETNSYISIYLPADSSCPSLEDNFDSSLNIENEEKNLPKILLVDDDPLVGFAIKSMLKGLNEECVVADNLSTAQSLMRRFEKSIELVLLDAILPSCDSVAIFRKIKLINPSINVVGFSGASDEQIQELLSAGVLEIIKKPVQVSNLKNLLQKYLSQKSNKKISLI